MSNPARYDNRSDPHWFRAHHRVLSKLPDPSCRWSEADVGKSLLEQAKRRGVIAPIGNRRLWKTNAAAWDMVLEITNDNGPEPQEQTIIRTYR